MKMKRMVSVLLAVLLAVTALPWASAADDTLRPGDRGEAVRHLQEMLVTLGYTTQIDGVYGDGTTEAVRRFQLAQGLTVDGKAGPDTMSMLALCIGQTTATSAPTSIPSSTKGLFAGDYSKMTLGTSSSRVRILQNALNMLGYNVGAADAVYGESTEAAVRWFQAVQGLAVDGKAGPDTLRRIESFFNLDGSLKEGYTPPTGVPTMPGTAVTAPPASAVGLFGGNYIKMTPGTVSSRVRILQKALNMLGYGVGNVDAVYGASTEAAVRWFQTVQGLAVDGKAGTETLKRIESFFNADGTLVAGYTPPGGSMTSAPVGSMPLRTLRPGDTGEDVRNLQARLQVLGYYLGVPDGVYGEATRIAVIAFQIRHNLTADGKAGPATNAMLFSSSALVAAGVTATPNVTATPTPSPLDGMPLRTLRPGDSGEDVRSLQNRLQALGYYTGTADAYYGSGTQAAVSAFQSRNGLTVDGKAGPDTNARLFSDKAIAANSTTSQPTQPSASDGANFFGGDYTQMTVGSSGDRVRVLQQALVALGYQVTMDGTYSAATEAAVKLFQQAQGLTVDGKAGPDTLRRVESLFNPDGTLKRQTAAPTATPTPTPTPTTPPAGTVTTPPAQYTIPTRTLRSGDKGEDVRSVQTRLKELGYYTGALDGTYGAGTMAAVKAFQLRNGLKADGKAGVATNALLFSDRAIAAQAVTAQPTQTPAPDSANFFGGDYTKLTRHSTGNRVRVLQQALVALGYQVTMDGVYGEATEAAVRLFQQMQGLSVDGVAGAATLQRVESLFNPDGTVKNHQSAPATVSPTPTPTPTPTTAVTASPTPTTPSYSIPTRTLRSGDQGADVLMVQTRLKELGFYQGILDGVYGPSTISAVRIFQQFYGLSVDGKAGPLTYALLFSGSLTPPATSTPTTSPGIYATLRKGSSGEAVLQMQKALLQLGYTVNTNGSYTNDTVTAVKAFQSANGLGVDGIAGTETLSKLYSGTAVGPTASTESPGTTTAGVMVNPPADSQIQLLHWFNDIKPSMLPGQPTVQVYDPATGLTWNIKIFSKGNHADGEPPTLQDTQIMYKAFGNRFTWDEKPVYVKLPNGIWCIASMHDHPHESDMIPASVNGFSMTTSSGVEDGHLCIHFPRDMAETQQHDPKNGVRHQNDIRKKWKEITGQDIPW